MMICGAPWGKDAPQGLTPRRVGGTWRGIGLAYARLMGGISEARGWLMRGLWEGLAWLGYPIYIRFA